MAAPDAQGHARTGAAHGQNVADTRGQLREHGVHRCRGADRQRRVGEPMQLLAAPAERIGLAPDLLGLPEQLDEDRHLRPQDVGNDRRADEIHRAELIAAREMLLVPVRRDEDDRRVAGAPPRPDEGSGLEPVQQGHVDVEEHHREVLAQEGAQGVRARRGGDETFPHAFQDCSSATRFSALSSITGCQPRRAASWPGLTASTTAGPSRASARCRPAWRRSRTPRFDAPLAVSLHGLRRQRDDRKML